MLRNVNTFHCILFHQFMYRMLCTINMNINHSIKLNSHLSIRRVRIPSTFYFSSAFDSGVFCYAANEVGKEKGNTERWLPQSIQCASSNNSIWMSFFTRVWFCFNLFIVSPQFYSFFFLARNVRAVCIAATKPHGKTQIWTGTNVTMS